MIDDHLMPSGDPAPVAGTRERHLETLGGTSRLELGLGGVVRVLRRRGLVLLLITAVAATAIYFGTSMLAKRYSSVAYVKITDPEQSLFVKSGSSVDITKEQRAVLLTLESPRLRTFLRDKLGARMGDVTSVTATGLEASPLIRLDAEASSPRLAARAANLGVAYVLELNRESARTELEEAAKANEARADELAGQVDSLSQQVASAPEGDASLAALQAELQAKSSEFAATTQKATQQRTDALTADGGVKAFEEAIVPKSPDFPKPFSWAVLGGLAVLMLSAAIIYGREELVGRFHTGDTSESRRAGARVLGVLPLPSGALPRGVVTGAGATVDEVGLQIVHLLGRGKPNVVLMCGIDGPAPEATTRRIAQAIAESGARVVYAGCRGIAEVDPGDDEFEAPVPRARLSVVQEQQTGGRLRVLDDGIAIGELTVARARTVLRRLTEQSEFVVIASPSPNVEPATLVLAELADATVMVAQHGVTRLRDAERAGTRLRRVGGAVLGVLSDPVKPGPAVAPAPTRTTGVSVG